jgi:hypothetical protein
MVSTTVTHIIGTVSLMLIFISVGSYYSMSIASFKNEVITVQLSKIANYIGSDTVDLVSLCYISDENQTLIKKITLPAGLTAYGYNMTIEKIGQSMLVRVYLISDSDVYGEYTLPWSTESSIRNYNDLDAETKNETKNCIHTQFKRPYLDPDAKVYSEDTDIMIWCLKTGDQITIGLGEPYRT